MDNKRKWCEEINISRNAFPEEDCRIHQLRPQKKLRYFNRITNLTDNRIHISVQEKLERAFWQDKLWQDPKNDSKVPTKRKKKFRKTFENMEGFSFVTPVTGLNRPNTGKEDNDFDEFYLYWVLTFPYLWLTIQFFRYCPTIFCFVVHFLLLFLSYLSYTVSVFVLHVV
jgi:hypothetical protein